MAPQEDGASLEEHLKSIWRQSGRMPDQLEVQPLPFELSHVWEWWQELHQTRSKGMSVEAISYTEIRNWSKLGDHNISTFEVRAIVAIDSTYIAHCRESEEQSSAGD